MSMAPDTVGDSANWATKLRGLFTNRRHGLTFGEAAMNLRESETTTCDGVNTWSELIREASFGDVPVSMSRQGSATPSPPRRKQ